MTSYLIFSNQQSNGTMAFSPDSLVFASLKLDRSADKSLQTQIYDFFRSSILDGKLTPGTRLPSTRALSNQWQISRTTLVYAFEQLIAEGYIVAKRGSGTRVAPSLSKSLESNRRQSRTQDSNFQISLSRQGKTILHEFEMRGGAPDVDRPFCIGAPAVDSFPRVLWRRLTSQVWSKTDPMNAFLVDPQGYLPLREQITKQVEVYRGVICSPENVFVVTGRQHAISLISQVLLNPGDAVAVGSPGYTRPFSAFASHGARLVGLPVDEEGLTWTERNFQPNAIYVAPSNHYPLSTTMTLQRRLDLLDWAGHHNSWVIEDDYDSEFNFSGRAVAALQGLDSDGRVIYLSTFNKALAPALQLGFIVVPNCLVDAFSAARKLIDRSPSFIEQAVLTKFIERGHYIQHVRKLRALYKERESNLRLLLREHIPELTVAPVDGGTHLIARLPSNLRDVDFCEKLSQNGLAAKPISSFFLGFKQYDSIVLGFSAWDEKTMEEAVIKMKTVFEEHAQAALTPSTESTSLPAPSLVSTSE